MQKNKNNKILSFIERTLFWEGSISIKYLMESFNLNAESANSFILEYITLVKQNIDSVNSTQETFFPNNRDFTFVYPENNYDNILKTSATENFPFFEKLPIINSVYDKDILRELLRALFKRDKVLTIRYQSLNSEIPEERKIVPYNLSYVRNRYHIRAFCLKKQDFRDFVLSRIITISNVSSYKSKPVYDKENSEEVKVVIKPHSMLSQMQKMCTEIEFGMENGKRVFTVKKSMLIYLLDDLRVGKDYYKPPFTVLELDNIQEVTKYLSE